MPENLTGCTEKNLGKVRAFWWDEYSKNNQLATGATFCEGFDEGAPGLASMGLCTGEFSAVKVKSDSSEAWMGHVRFNRHLAVFLFNSI